MNNTNQTDEHREDRTGLGGIGLAGGAGLLMIICCAGPVLIASGTLAGIGAWVGSPWVIVGAVALAGLVLAALALGRLRDRAGTPSDESRPHCCPPTLNRPQAPNPKEEH